MIIVTGGAGLIGSAVVWELNRRGESDILLVDHLGKSNKWQNLVNLSYAHYMDKSEFLEKVANDTLPQRPRAIVHMGACSSTIEQDADYLMHNNTHYSNILCKYADKTGARMVHASSAATYGDGSQGFADEESKLSTLRPLNMYGYSKHLFDLWTVREKTINNMATLKFFNVYGPNEYHKGVMRSMVCKAFEEITQTGRIRLFKSNDSKYPDGGQMRDFIYVKDCAQAICWLLGNPHINGIFNLGTGKARSWNDLATAVFAAMNLPPAIDYVEMPENLRGQYQNYTEAPMQKLLMRGLNMNNWHSLEAGVKDYVQNYLMQTANSHLGNNWKQGL